MKKELTHDLTQGSVAKTMLMFAGPMMIGNLLQQCYNIADTFIVGRFLGSGALAAVGSAYTLMTFLTSVLIGLCMGSGSVFSFYFGKKDYGKMKDSMAASLGFIGSVTIVMNVVIFAGIHPILRLLQTPEDIYEMMYEYVFVIFWGVFFVFLYNYYAFLLRAIGNSAVPLYFLVISSVINIFLDVLFVVTFEWGIGGAAIATALAQAFAGIGILAYVWLKEPTLRFTGKDFRKCGSSVKEVVRFSVAASVQQSIMNFGILMIQGLVNSFGTTVMAAFAAAVKIDSFAYMPAQEFSNAYSLYISQNHGAGEKGRVQKGTKTAIAMSVGFCVAVSGIIFFAAPYLMMIFVDAGETEIIRLGVEYLRIEGSFYCGIGLLFLLYAYYRGIGKPEMSVMLTVISLGTRVLLAYTLAPRLGVTMIWWAIPIGWCLADVTGMVCMRKK